jgi:hypothetical protein
MSQISKEESNRRQRHESYISRRPEGSRRRGDRRLKEEAQVRVDSTFEDGRARFGHEEADAKDSKELPSLQ